MKKKIRSWWKKFVDWCWGVAFFPLLALLVIVFVLIFYGGWALKHSVILW